MRRKWELTICFCVVCAIGIFAALISLKWPMRENIVHNYDENNIPSIEISFFGNKYEPKNVEVLEEIITGFMQERPDVSLSYESLKGAAYYEALRKRAEAGKINDIYMVDHDTSLVFTREGLLADLSSLSAVNDFSDDMLSQMRDADGKIYWVPTSVSAFGLYCNIDLLEAHHQRVPRNLREFEAVCSYFVGQGITPIIANNDISIKTLVIAKGFYPLYRGGKQREAFARLNRGEEKLCAYLRPGLALACRFCERGYIDASKALKTKKTSQDLLEYAKGEAPFMLTGAWAAERFKSMEPGFSFTIVPYPVLDEGAVLVINPDTRLGVNARGKNREAAMAFVAYFLQPDNLQKFDDNQSSFCPLKKGHPSSVREIAPLVESYHTGTAVIGSDSLLDFPIWETMTEASKRLLTGDDLEQIMTWMDAAVLKECAK